MSIPAKIVVNKIESEFAELEKRDLWHTVYSKIRNDTSRDSHLKSDEAKKIGNRNFNRYKDVNPYDHTRVVLARNGFDYINASYVDVVESGRRYILAQGPLPSTVSHFWLMVWEQSSQAIVMLNNVLEKSQAKCAQYWPESEEESLIFNDVDLTVQLLHEEDCCHYVIRKIKLTDNTSKEQRTVTHFHFTTWPDFGVPKNPYIFLKFLRVVRQSGAMERNVGRPIIHCSAGIGRSGTFCLVDSCIILASENGADNVDIKDVLMNMRQYRMGLIQTAEQLRFSYLAIIKGIHIDWNSTNDDDLPINEDFPFDPSNLKNQNDKDDTSDKAPAPPPRNQSWQLKPLPDLPLTDCSSSDNETDSGKDSDSILNDVSSSRLNEIRKRKHQRGDEISDRVLDKVEEMVKKKNDSDIRKQQQRSLMKKFGIGLGITVVSGVFLAFLHYQKSSI